MHNRKKKKLSTSMFESAKPPAPKLLFWPNMLASAKRTMWNALAGSAIFIIFGLGIGTAQSSFPSDAAFIRGVGLQQQGDWIAAQTAYLESLRLSPRRVDALTNLGVVYAHQGDYARAVSTYRKVLVVVPGMTAVRLNLGIAEYQMRDYHAAERDLGRVETKEPRNHQARSLRGIALTELGRVRDGIAELTIAHKQDPQDRAVSYALANAYITSGNPDPAEVLANEIFEHVDSAEAHLIFGSLHEAAGRHKAAMEELAQAEKLNPALPTLHSTLGTAYLKAGDRESAREQFRKELQLNPQDFNANLRLGRILREDADLQSDAVKRLREGTLQEGTFKEDTLKEAAILLRQATRLRPGNVDALYESALLQDAQGHTAEATVSLETLVRNAPNFLPGHVLLARLYRKQGRLLDARREQDRIEELNRDQQGKQASSSQAETPPPQL
jgi:tetratricopeptide (TPR) repeat protein